MSRRKLQVIKVLHAVFLVIAVATIVFCALYCINAGLVGAILNTIKIPVDYNAIEKAYPFVLLGAALLLIVVEIVYSKKIKNRYKSNFNKKLREAKHNRALFRHETPAEIAIIADVKKKKEKHKKEKHNKHVDESPIEEIKQPEVTSPIAQTQEHHESKTHSCSDLDAFLASLRK